MVPSVAREVSCAPMMIIAGSRLYGRVARVPGVFHVATEFMHLYYMPLIPVYSWLVLSEKREGMKTTWTGVKIRMRWMSVFLAWSLGLAIWAGLAELLTIITWMNPGPVQQATAPQASAFPVGPVSVFASIAIAVILVPRLPWIRYATAEEAAELCERPEVPEAVRVAVKEYFAKK